MKHLPWCCITHTYCFIYYRQTSSISCIQNSSRHAVVLPNPLKPGVKSKMKMWFEQRRLAMVQLNVNDQQVYYLLRWDLCMMTSSNGNIFRVTGPLCREFTGPGEFPTQRPVTRSFDVYFDLRLNKRLCKQSWGWWFETLLCPLWRHSNG